MRRRPLSLLTLLLLASMATASACAQQPAAAQEYLLAHLCHSYTAAQNAELPRVVQLRAAAQRALKQPRLGSRYFGPFWTAAFAEPLPSAASKPQGTPPAHPALATLRGSLQPHAPPTLS